MKANTLLFSILAGLSVGPSIADTPTTPLVDANALQAIACGPGVVVLDVRSEKIDGQSSDDYAQGHIPCAIHSDYIKDGWRAKVAGVPGMLPPVQKLEGLIGGLGIDDDTRVVIAPFGADSKSMASATRVYWTLKVLGHDRVSILDGGTTAYAKDKSRPLEQGAQRPEPKQFKAVCARRCWCPRRMLRTRRRTAVLWWTIGARMSSADSTVMARPRAPAPWPVRTTSRWNG